MSSKQAGFVDNLLSAIRENPLAAALVGGGALWLLVGDEKIKSAARSATAAASPIADIGARNVRAAVSGLQRTAAPPTAPEMDHDTFTGVVDNMRETGSAASDAMTATAARIKDGLDQGASYARENLGNPGKEAFAKAQSSLADMLERQPLALGAVGLAIGAAIAGAFQTSGLESELVGELSDDVKADLNTRAGAVARSLREAADTVKAEVGDTAAEAVDRMKQAGLDAAGAAREKIKSP